MGMGSTPVAPGGGNPFDEARELVRLRAEVEVLREALIDVAELGGKMTIGNDGGPVQWAEKLIGAAGAAGVLAVGRI